MWQLEVGANYSWGRGGWKKLGSFGLMVEYECQYAQSRQPKTKCKERKRCHLGVIVLAFLT